MPDLDPESEEIKEIYAQYGLAAYQAQCLERSMAILLAVAYGPDPSNITRGQFDELLHSNFKKTLGTLLKLMQKTTSFPEEFESSLSNALVRRNWLIHHYFWDRAGHFMSEGGRRHMLQELKQVSELFSSIDNGLQDICDDWSQKHGISEKLIEEFTQKIMEEGDGV